MFFLPCISPSVPYDCFPGENASEKSWENMEKCKTHRWIRCFCLPAWCHNEYLHIFPFESGHSAKCFLRSYSLQIRHQKYPCTAFEGQSLFQLPNSGFINDYIHKIPELSAPKITKFPFGAVQTRKSRNTALSLLSFLSLLYNDSATIGGRIIMIGGIVYGHTKQVHHGYAASDWRLLQLYWCTASYTHLRAHAT